MSSQGVGAPREHRYAAVGRRIREARGRIAPSALALARRLQIDQSKMSKYELGKELPSPAHRLLLEDAFAWPRGRILVLAGMAESPESLDWLVELLESRALNDTQRALVVGIVSQFERLNQT